MGGGAGVSRYLANPRRRPTEATDDDGASLRFHRTLPGYAASPLVDLGEAAARAAGVGRLLVKDERERFGLPAFKMLGASWAVYRAVLDRLDGTVDDQVDLDGEPFDVLRRAVEPLRPLGLAAATDGNHGRAVARMAAILELPCHIYVPAGTVDARISAIEGEGATVTVVDGTYDDAIRVSAECGEEWLVVSDTSWPGYTDIPRWVGDGYATILHELDEQLDSVPDAVVVPLGVGAFGAAVAAGLPADLGAPPFILGVEPDDAACVQAAVAAGEVVEVPGPHRSIMAGLNCGLASRTALPAVMDRFDGFTTVSDEACASALRDLAELGFDCGECGAATLAGLTSVVGHVDELGPDATVVLLCTEGVTDPDNFRRIVGRGPQEAALARS